MFQFREDLSPGGRDKPVPRSRHIHQPVSVIVADDERVESVRPWDIYALAMVRLVEPLEGLARAAP
jgi:hypothetical protein